MRRNTLAILFILSVFGLLVLNRFDFSQKVVAKVSRDTGSTYSIGHEFKRGEMIRTAKGEFVELIIGYLIVIQLDENTNLQLKSLSKNNIRVGFGHGRMLVSATDGGVITIDTPTAQHTLETSGKLSSSREDLAKASFIGYDFKRLTSVIPIVNTIHTTIPLLDRSFDTTTPITIHDVNPPTVEPITFDIEKDSRAEFYRWTNHP